MRGKVCAVFGCSNYEVEKNARSFFRFPRDKNILWRLGLFTTMLAAYSHSAEEEVTTANNNLDLNSAQVKSNTMLFPNHKFEDGSTADNTPQAEDHAEIPDKRVTAANYKYQDQQNSGSSQLSFDYPGYTGGQFEYFPTPDSPVAGHYGELHHKPVAGHHGGLHHKPVAAHHGDLHHDQFHGHEIDEHEPENSSRDNAFSFLAYLVVLSLLQGNLIALTKSNSVYLATRRRRDLINPENQTDVPTVVPQEKTEKTWLLNESQEVQCIQHRVCDINRLLASELGTAGGLLGQYVSQWAAQSINSGWRLLVIDAGKAGRQGEDCEIIYHGCPDLAPG
ncbi:uncharacterized protein [Anabrus simplex]|uniref:uncharacterized protein n=1 Tax=Anabrus simplex TaxID=316456 RepID=UPI0035A38B8D